MGRSLPAVRAQCSFAHVDEPERHTRATAERHLLSRISRWWPRSGSMVADPVDSRPSAPHVPVRSASAATRTSRCLQIRRSPHWHAGDWKAATSALLAAVEYLDQSERLRTFQCRFDLPSSPPSYSQANLEKLESPARLYAARVGLPSRCRRSARLGAVRRRR
jgi:hypothetical protein